MTVKNVRVSDRNDFIKVAKTEFIVRKRPLTKQDVYRLCLAAVVIVLGVTIIVYNETMLGAMLCVLIGSIMLYFGRHMERMQGMLQATEFMNALFSSSLSKGYKFCTVAKPDGEIVYLNRPFQDLFPEFLENPKRNFDMLFSMQKVSDDARQKLVSAISHQREEKVAVSINVGVSNSAASMSIIVEPIERPAGFVMVRGQ